MITAHRQSPTTDDDEADWLARDSAANYQHALAMMRDRLDDERKQHSAPPRHGMPQPERSA